MTKRASLAPLLERFFTQRLMQQRQASPHTISSYRDTFRQLLKFAELTLHKPPSRLNFEEVDAPLIVAFLDDEFDAAVVEEPREPVPAVHMPHAAYLS